MVELLIATENEAKAARLRRICLGAGVGTVDAARVERPPDDVEDGASHLANAVRKAVAWSRLHRDPTIASDGGLAIPALGPEWISLVTRRATGGDVSDEEHASRLLRRMRELHGEQRQAHWTEAIAVARSGAVVGAWEASGLHGRIAEEFLPATNAEPGFWVSGLWLSEVSGRRLWELSTEELAEEGDPWSTLSPPVIELLARLAG
ncbi:MAG: non-canonical purine NTP pyrophosphatase [Dehalococcoidia bacterium]